MSAPTFEYLLARSVKDEETGCWNWTGRLDRDGYGRAFQGISAHRAMAMTQDEIPPGMQVDHLCRNRRCVNPKHLELVTSRENTLRGVALSAQNACKTECLRGHPFDEINTYIRNDGKRVCKKCLASRSARRYWARKAGSTSPPAEPATTTSTEATT